MSKEHEEQNYIEVQMGRYNLFFKKSYNVIYTINDLLIGLWFLVGSIFFLFESMKTVGIWFFVVGSLELLIRPIIKLIHDVQLRKHLSKGFNKKN